ncbi:MAG: T9SS type A sorting domain-containing protein [Flavobacteriales bacterium]|nr:T9SS type A sorting domain-containing protein [Flavobacteriales bacterium]
MKPLYISLIGLLLITKSSGFIAQISITEYDMPNPGAVYKYELSTDLLSEDFSLTGSNYTWDYSSATMNTTDTVKIVSVGSTPIVYQFYFNNQFTQAAYYSDYAQKGRDINAFGQVSITNRYDFFGVNPNSLEIKGFGAEINGTPASIKYDTIDQLYPFPMYDGMPTHYSSGSYVVSIPSLGTYGQWIRREVTVDGYGSLTTPYFTYSNTLRVKTVLHQRDTFYVDQFMFGQTVDRPEEIIYEWFTNTEKAPVMKVVLRGGQNTEAKYLSPIAASVDQESILNISITKTSEEGIYIIQGSTSQITGNIYDVNGKKMRDLRSNQIDLTTFESGIYFVEVFFGNEHQVFELIK